MAVINVNMMDTLHLYLVIYLGKHLRFNLFQTTFSLTSCVLCAIYL